jgi:hypothetical protein
MLAKAGAPLVQSGLQSVLYGFLVIIFRYGLVFLSRADLRLQSTYVLHSWNHR